MSRELVRCRLEEEAASVILSVFTKKKKKNAYSRLIMEGMVPSVRLHVSFPNLLNENGVQVYSKI
jgi:hypothetical protein